MSNYDLPPRALGDGTYTEKTQSTPEAAVHLGRPPGDVFTAVKSSRNGHWTVESEQTNPAPVNGRYLIHIGGDPRNNTRLGAALRLFGDHERESAAAQATSLAESGEKMTVLVDNGNAAQAIEGTGGVYRGDPVLFLKGSKAKFYPLDRLKIVETAAGYGKQGALASAFDAKAVQVPVTVPVHLEGIPDYGDDRPDGGETIAAVFMVDGADFGNGREPGCMFFATDLMTEDGIVNGYFWSPDDAGLLTSESSSYYVDGSVNQGRATSINRLGGRIRDYVPNSLSYDDAWKVSEDRAAGYAAVLGR